MSSSLGVQMISTQNRPTVIGRYDFEKQNLIMRYQADTKDWITLSAKLAGVGKSDFAVLQLPSNINKGVYLNPNMNSGLTKINSGSGATRDWRNQFNLVLAGNIASYERGL